MSGEKRRIAGDLASQAAPLAAALIERVVLAGVLIREWGLAGFEYWSLAMALVGLLTILDSGCLMNFSNRIAMHWTAGEPARAVAVYRQSNAIFLLLGLLMAALAAAVGASPAARGFVGIDPDAFPAEALALLTLVGASSAMRMAMTNVTAVYRARLGFGRVTLWLALLDVGRALSISAAAMAGAWLVEAAWVNFAVTLAGLWLIALDIGARYPEFRFRLALPRRSDLAGSLVNSLHFGLPLLPTLAIQQGPVLVLGGAAALGGGAVASFVLLRTLANLARLVVQRLVNVLGMELARRQMGGRPDEAGALLGRMNAVIAVLFGFMAGGIVAYGDTIVALWSGRGGLFDPLAMAVLLLPFVLTPSFPLSMTFLMYRDTPKAWTVGTFLHLVLALGLWFALPGVDLVLRVALAVSVGELIGLALPVIWARSDRDFAALARQEAKLAAIACGCALLVGGLERSASALASPLSFPGLLLHGASMALALPLLLGLFARRDIAALRGAL